MKTINRTLAPFAKEFLKEKILLLTGPRQVGKTFFSKALTSHYTYLNYDNTEMRQDIAKKNWERNKNLLILDELHKMKKWKQWLKGIYDVEGIETPLLVTGSARLDTFKKTGDSLAGRHYLMHLCPFSVNEIDSRHPKKVVTQFLKLGQFPEPFLKGSETKAKLWRRTHQDIIVRQDLFDLEKVRELVGIENLIALLSERVGQGISYANLSRDLSVSPPTIKKWIEVLESLYVIHVVRPYSKKLSKTILKEPKIYFHDIGQVKDEAQRLENLIANHLFKRNKFIEDTAGTKCNLYYYRDKEQREVDFLIEEDRSISSLIEVKTSDDELSRSLLYLKTKLNNHPRAYQLVLNLKKEKNSHGIPITDLSRYLTTLET
ncbi:MAG: hypothetical protein A2202_08690 [Bdellovibrionales bacterium RIFOXYA1_FULL_36_14]|nr:MAG: hypothetical protein A2202_08690 [Bdellovibrionales bacterium RIFOXYA1_FULL_36_14]